MFKVWKKKTGAYGSLANLKKLLDKIGVKPVYFIAPAIFSFLAASFDGLGKSLLIPIMKGIISMDYSFIKDYGFIKQTPLLKTMIGFLSSSWLGSNISIFIFLLLLAFMVTLVQYFLSYMGHLTFAYQIRKFSNNMRKAIFNRYLSFGKSFFDKESFGHLDNILIDFTNSVAFKTMGLQQIFTEIFRLAVYFIMFCVISWKLTVFVVLAFPALHYLSQWLIKNIRMTSGYLAAVNNNLNKKIFNVLSNIALVKSYAREDFEKEDFCRISDQSMRLQFSIDKKVILITPLQNIFMVTAIMMLLSAIAFMVLQEKSGNIAGFLLYLYLLKTSANSLGAITTFRSILAEIDGPLREISEVFNDTGKGLMADGVKMFTGLKEKIDFCRLNFSYPNDRRALKDITFSIKKGSCLALVGPSGSGKTTLVNLLMRLYDCSPRSILIDGVDIRDFTLKSFVPRMALVSQNTLLFNGSLKDNITYGLGSFSEEQILDSLKSARLYDFVKQLPMGLETLIGDQGVQLSGGERQRVSITRALLKNAEILILDEATSALDTKTEMLIQEAIEEIIRERTVIVIAHRLSTVKNSDKIVVIEEGTIVEQGSLKELLEKRGRFYQYWEGQKFY